MSTSSSYKILEDRTVWQGWGRLREIRYRVPDKDGSPAEHKGELYDSGDAVAILLYHKRDRKVLLVRQFRLPVAMNDKEHTGYILEACAGKIEDLSPLATACKEIEEETGYRITAPQPIMELYMTPGSVAERLSFFIAAYDDAPKVSGGGGLKEEGEALTIHELAFEEALAMMNRGAIRDAKTVILLQYAVMNDLFNRV